MAPSNDLSDSVELLHRPQRIGRGAAEREDGTHDSGPSSFILQALEAILSPQQRLDLLQIHLQEQASRALSIPSSRLEIERPLGSLGLDSLTALQLKNSIEAELAIELPLADLLTGPSIAQLASRILLLLDREADSAALPSSAPTAQFEGGLTLSHGQRALWFLHSLAPESPAYNLSAAVEIESWLDAEALRRSLQTLLDRHPALRATFFEQDGKPLQRIEPQRLHFERVQASSWSEKQLQQRLSQEARRPFNLQQGPLLRACLFVRSSRDDGPHNVLLLAVHHIAADLWSLGIFLQELGQLYQGYCSGHPAQLPPLPLEYPQFAARQAGMLSGEKGERLWDYWRQRLSGRLPVLGLPQDRPRPPLQSFQGGSVPLHIKSAAARRIQALGRSHQATLYMTLLAAFQAWLQRYTLQDDVLVGSPASGRSSAQLSGLVGYFVNPVVLRADLSSDPPFSALLDQVRQTVLDALSHQDFPFALLVERLQPERDLSRSPLFQTMFALQQAPLLDQGGFAALALGEAGRSVQLGDLKLRSLPLQQQVAQFDLSLTMALDGDCGELLGSLQYDCALFERSSVQRWAGHFRNLLLGAAERPQARISELPLFSSSQRQQMFLEWNDSRSNYPRDDCLHNLVAAQARRTPDAVAAVRPEQGQPAQPSQISYGELDSRANRLGRRLRRLGARTETALGLACRPSLEMIAGLLAILKSGACYIPLHPGYPRGRQEFMLSEGQALALLTEQGNSNEAPQGAWHRICLDSRAEWQDDEDSSSPGSTAFPESLAYVIFTSGSTGKPKGVAVTHRSVQRLVFNTNYTRLRPGISVSQASNIAFDVSAFEIWGALTHGSRLVLIPARTKLDPQRLIECLRQQEVSLVNLVPSLFNQLVEEDPWAFARVDELMLAGEAIDPAPARRALAQGPPRRLLNVYGPTENATFSTWHPVRQVPAAASSVPIGRPISNSGAFILDQSIRQLPVGVPGELHLSGEGLARCYLGRPCQTARSFVPHPFSDRPGERLYKSGDLAVFLPDGCIEFLGRLDHQVKIRGFRVELGEIEAVLAAHPGVRQAVATVRDGRLIGYVCRRRQEAGGRKQEEGDGDSSLPIEPEAWSLKPEASLRRHLQARLPEYMIPSLFVVLDELPLTPNGKVDRKALPDPAPQEAAQWESPATIVEELLAAIWSEVLEVDRVGRNDRFFDLGGHSLLAVQALSRIRRRLEADLPVRAFFEAPRLADLARRVEQARGMGSVSAAPIEAAPSGTKPPLSNAQQRLWFLDQLEPGGTLYNMPAALRLRGPLDVEALEEALNGIRQRHQALRSRFPAREGKPWLVVEQWKKEPIQFEDLSGRPQADLTERLRQQAQTPFDLAAGPLLRIRLLRLGEDDHLLCLTAHHIVFDGWSLGIFASELTALYNARLRGQQPRLPELPIQYADYASWQEQWLKGEEAQKQVRYWRKALAGAPSALELPGDRPRQSKQSHRGRTLKFTFSPGLQPRIQQLCRQQVASLFMALAAGFQALLLRLTGRQDVVLGVPLANREQAEVQGLIGFFVNSLVLRVRLDGNPTFLELLGRVRDACLEGYARQEIPFEKLVEEIRPERSLSQNPIYQVVFGLQNVPPPRLELDGLKAAPLAVDSGASKFDLSLYLEESPQGLGGNAEFSSDLFDTATILRLLGHFEAILISAVANPDLPISELSPLAAAQRHQVLVEWNSPEQECGQDPLLTELFEDRAQRASHAVSVLQEDRLLSCAELNRRANRLAHRLQAMGAAPDEPVGVFCERSLDLIAALLAIVTAGCAYMPIDPSYPADRIAFLLEDSGAPLLLTQKALRPRLPADLRQVLLLDEGWRQTAQHSDRNPLARASAGHLAYVIYTSGSTGRPKGTMIQHGSLASYNRTVSHIYGISPSDRVLQFCSLSFDTSIEEIVPALTQGAALVLRTPSMLDSMPVFLGLVQEWSVSVISLPTAFWHEIVDRMEADQLTLPDCLKLVIIAGERAIPDRLTAWLKLAGRYPSLVNTYGLTESTVVSTAGNLSSPNMLLEGLREVPLGGPIRETQLFLLDSRLQPVPAGVSGELFVGGALLARGYRNRPSTTAERFTPHPFSQIPGSRLYRTGDLALYRPQGGLEFLGRLDHQVKIRGYRIELGEIEARLAQHPAVEKAVVMALEEQPGRKRLAAYVVGKEAEGKVRSSQFAAGSLGNGSASGAFVSDLRGFLEESLPEFMVPAAFAVLEDLPLTPNGKVDRKALAETPVETAGGHSSPETPCEQLLAGIWCDVLGLEKVGREDNFFELGGHSLLATQVVSRLGRAFGVDLALRTLFEAPALSALARRIESARQAHQVSQTAPIPPAPRQKPLPLSFAQQRLWLLDRLQPDSPLYNLSAALHLKGRLDIPALHASLDEVRRRHESLRTSFQVDGGQPLQVIQEWRPAPLPLLDLSHYPPERRQAELDHLTGNEARRPFNLSRGPLFRTFLARLGRRQHVLIASMHHIISDGWSLGVLLRELGTLYGKFAVRSSQFAVQKMDGRSENPEADCEPRTANRELPLPALPIQYADFACWQRDYLRGEVFQKQSGYWKERLEGAAALQLATDRPRPAVASQQGDVEPFCWPPRLVAELHSLSRKLDATPFMILLTAFQALLFRYTSQRDISVGTPIANRNRPETERLIGFFVNMLVMRGHPSAACRFQELAAQLRETALQAYAHQDVSFEVLVDELVSRRDLSRSPLFQVFLAWQDTPLPLEIPGLETELEELHSATSKFDLSLSMNRLGQGLEGWAEYSTDLFDRTTVQRLLAHLRNLLEGAIADPERRLESLPLLSEGQRAQVRLEWNDSQADFQQDLCLHQLFRQQAETSAESVAAAIGSGTATLHLSYGELERRSNRLGHQLRDRGAEAENVVGLYCQPSLQMMVGLVGILKSGAAYLPLHPDYPKERLAFMLQDAAALAVLTGKSLLESLPELAGHICLDADWNRIAGHPAGDPGAATTPRSLAYVIYTSGSTGKPKGVCIDHQAVARLVLNANYADLRPHGRVSQASNIAFDVSAFEIWGALLHGACLVLIPHRAKLSPQRLIDCLRQHAATVVNLVPSLFNQAVRHDPAAFASLGDLMLAGEALDPEPVRQVLAKGPPRRLLNVYGPTENATFSTWHQASQVHDQASSIPIGRPISNSQAFVLGPSLELLPAGVPGELHLGGKGLARGYLKRPAQSAERFIPHPFSHILGDRLYKTGDVALLRPNGEIDFLGRIDHQMKIRGFRVELGEIEAVLGRHPAVSQSVVVCRQAAPGEQQLVAYVVAHSSEAVRSSQFAVRSSDTEAGAGASASSRPQLPADPDSESLRTANRELRTALRAFLRRQLPEHMVPAVFVELDALPLTPNGKVDRGALPDARPGRSDSKRYVAPRNPVEERLVAIWSELLGGVSVGVEDDFFEAGGHSLLAFQVTSRLREEFGAAIGLETFFRAPTIAALAVAIERDGEDDRPSMPPAIQPLRRESLRRATAKARESAGGRGGKEREIG